jgi:hypothetical protein
VSVRIGALLGGIEEWHVECLGRLRAADGVELVGATWVEPPRPAAGGAVARWAWRRGGRPAGWDEVAGLLGPVPGLEEAEPEVVLALGLGRPDRLVGELARVWSFRHEREWYDEGLPLSLPERLGGEPVSYVSLDALGPGPEDVTPLCAAWMRTIDDSWRQHHDELVAVLAGWPAELARRPTRLPAPEPPARPATRPGNARLVALAARMAARRLRRLVAGALRHDAWNVGVLPAAPGALVDGSRPEPRWMKALPGRYLADPFGLDLDNRLHVLVEDYSLRRRKGVISHCEVGPDGVPGPPTEVLELPTHASYPYLLRHGGRIHLVPETAAAGEVALYEATHFPRGWERRATLLHGVAALDSTIFEHEGRWWLLCTVMEGGQPNLALHGWHAPDLLGPWTPHDANPLKRDVRSARPAGTPFVHQGALHRPAQDCARGYGRAVVINRVDALSPTDFAETPVAVLEPESRGPYSRGLHTLAGVGSLTLVDGNRSRFDRYAFAAAVSRRAAILIGAFKH